MTNMISGLTKSFFGIIGGLSVAAGAVGEKINSKALMIISGLGLLALGFAYAVNYCSKPSAPKPSSSGESKSQSSKEPAENSALSHSSSSTSSSSMPLSSPQINAQVTSNLSARLTTPPPTSSSTQALSSSSSVDQSTLHSLLIEPYHQAYYNFCDGLRGTKSIAGSSQRRVLNLRERVTCLALALFLCIPLFNTFVLLSLKKISSSYLYRLDGVPCIYPSRDDDNPLFRTLQINPAKLRDIPRPIDLDRMRTLLLQAHPPVTLDQLTKHFNRLFADLHEEDVVLTDQGEIITKREITLRGLLRRYPPYHDLGYNRMAGEEIEVFLQMIILELRNPHIPDERKREMLKRLVSASLHCVPRKHSEALKVYRILSNQEETVEEVILQHVQLVKEDLLLQYYSLSREPVQTLNFIRKEVGFELGLDCSRVNLSDIYMGFNDARSPDNPASPHRFSWQFLQVFHRLYTPSNLIRNIKEYLNDRIGSNPEFSTNISQWVNHALRSYRQAGDITDREIDSFPEPYFNDYNHSTAPYRLTDLGVKFLLVHSGILNDQIPKGHLVRAPSPAPFPQPAPQLAAAAVGA